MLRDMVPASHPAEKPMRDESPRPRASRSAPRASWRQLPKVRPCLGCGRPRLSRGASDRLHAQCRQGQGENDGERGAVLI